MAKASIPSGRTETACDTLLAEIDAWRVALADHIALRNADLSERDVSLAAQRAIVGIVFLRICEARGIEGRVRDRNLAPASIFAPAVGAPTPALNLDDQPLRDIISRFCDPDCPFAFAELPADFLGRVYERFLGKAIRLTAGRRAVVEERTAVRKAGGVFYTPSSVFDYIVRHSVGQMLEGKSSEDVGGLSAPCQVDGIAAIGASGENRRLRARMLALKGKHGTRHSLRGEHGARFSVLDPACGTGAFLLGAYQFLLDWYRDAYVRQGAERHAGGMRARLFRHSSGEWRLTFLERKRILLSHIYGVDIDRQAVEVTRLALVLKALEGIDDLALDAPMSRDGGHEAVTFDVDRNIKCGDSLIGPDFFDDKPQANFDAADRRRINAFDWQGEFEEIMQAGGFDAVIGNPPYLNAVEARTRFDDERKRYLRSRFASARGTIDASILFQELGLRLVRPGGLTSFIVPNKFLSAPFGAAFRRLAAETAELRRLADYSRAGVFPGVGVYPCVYVLQRVDRPGPCRCELDIFRNGASKATATRQTARAIHLRDLGTWDLLFSQSHDLLERIRSQFAPIGECYEVVASASAGEAYEIQKGLVDADSQGHAFRFVTSGAIDRYLHLHGARPIRYLKQQYKRPWLPRDCQSLSANRRRQYASEKLILAGMTRRLEAVWDDGAVAGAVPSIQILNRPDSPYPLKFVLAVINSKFISWYFAQHFGSLSLAGGYLRVGVPQVSQLPLVPMQSGGGRDALVQRLIGLADRMMGLQVEHRHARGGHERAAIGRLIAAMDASIDAAVFEWYGVDVDSRSEIELE